MVGNKKQSDILWNVKFQHTSLVYLILAGDMLAATRKAMRVCKRDGEVRKPQVHSVNYQGTIDAF